MRSWVSALVIALMGCGGGGGARPDTGAAGGGGAPQGTGGMAGTGGSAGDAGIGGTGVAGGAGGAPGTGGTTGGAPGTGGAAGAGGMAGAAGGGPAAGGIGGMNCRPDVLIVQDKSGSMNNDDNDLSCSGGCAANSKWSQVATAITNIVTSTDGAVNWGIKYFSDNGACDASGPPSVPIAAMAGKDVAASLAATLPAGNTPTRDAITVAAAYLQTLTDTNPKFLLLVTDGLPNCPVGCATMARPSSSCTQTDNPTEDAAAEMAVATAVSQGFNTFVVGVGNVGTAQNTLNQLAMAGGEAQTGAATSYYPATDETALESALTSIVGKIAGCQRP